MLPKIVSLVILLISALIDVKYVQFIINPDVQLIFGTIIIAIIVFFDAWAGLLLAIAVFILYLRVYSKKYGINMREIITGKKTGNYPMETLVDAYITPKNLEDAQTNIVSDSAYNKEIKGIKGVYDEPVYGAQGIDTKMPGFGAPFPGETFSRS
jgi:hypothetical protein